MGTTGIQERPNMKGIFILKLRNNLRNKQNWDHENFPVIELVSKLLSVHK
jgi:hypothetical protein